MIRWLRRLFRHHTVPSHFNITPEGYCRALDEAMLEGAADLKEVVAATIAQLKRSKLDGFYQPPFLGRLLAESDFDLYLEAIGVGNEEKLTT